MRWFCVLAAAALAVAGCAGNIPREIREGPPSQPIPAQIREGDTAPTGARVRWGGTILAVHNRERATDIEVLARPLDTTGEPRERADGQGRFLARVGRFVDPAEYPRDRLITVSGTLSGVETRPVGDYPYRFPVVEAEVLHLWPEPVDYPPYPYHPWSSPWYDPWYPWRRPWYGPWYGW